MTMILRINIAVLLLLCTLAGARAQVRPDQFPLQANPNNANFETYSQKNGINTRASLLDLKEYFVPNVDSAWQAFTFTDSIGVVDSLRMMFIKDNRGRVFYVDADGDALLLKDTAQAVGNVYALATLADTSTVASPVEGDIAVIGSDTLLFYETYWLMFAGGAGGIYGGSGTVPASTWVEQLGSLIFDIDSLGSFTVGDIDEKSTGAYISISNSAGNDGHIVMKSGSGKGTTDATIEMNNYQLPGNTPTSEGLATGDYFWIVSNAGVRKGQDSTGWIHIDSLLAGYTTGSGTSGTIPIWNGTSSLGNSSLTEASGVLSSSLTGALKLPAGTDAQDPVWAAGMLRYNTTANGIQGYDGTAERYLPWADADNWASGRIPFADGNQLITASTLTYVSSIFYTGTSSFLRINPNTDGAAVSIGTTYAHGSSYAGVAIGSGSGINGADGVAIGYNARSTGTGQALGRGCNVASGAIGVGNDADGNASGAVAIGINVDAAQNAIAIGLGTTNVSYQSIGIGHNADVVDPAEDAIAIGNQSYVNAREGIAIGDGARSSGIGAIAIGKGVYTTQPASIALGNGSTTTAENEMVVGSIDTLTAERGGFQVTNIYFGTGKNRKWFNQNSIGAGGSYTLNGSGAYGTDYAGGNVTIAGGKGTGTGTPGDVIFSTSDATASGSTLQTLAQRVWVKGETGQLSVGSSSPNASALLQVESTTQGFLPPRMTTAQRDAIGSPAAGLVIFNTTTTKLECYDGSTWQAAW